MTETKLDYALNYAGIDWHVFPLHFIEKSGLCSCRKKCKSPGKHPIENGGFRQATIDKEKIKQWWKKHPNANIGVATGKTSGIFVLDIDPKNGGDDSLDKIESVHGKVPDDVFAVTGSKGQHYVFNYPDLIGKCTTDLFPGIDTRGDGGYIVVAPSNHISGSDYFFDSEADPLEGSIPVDAPAWLLNKLKHKKPLKKVSADVQKISDTEVKRIRTALFYIPADNRDDWLKIGMALHSTNSGDQSFGIWTEWSQQSEKFDLSNQRSTWNSFTYDRGLSIASLFALAKKYGWVVPISHNQHRPRKKKQQQEKSKPNLEEVTDNTKILNRYIFISSRNRIFDTSTGKEMTRDGFDGLLLHIHESPKAANWLLKQKGCVKVDDLIYLPGETTNPVSKGSCKLWNIWSDPGVGLPDYASNKDVEPWLEHLEYLYPNKQEQEHILNWFASTLQNPQIKINHALLIGGTQRIGKDTLINPLRYGLGERNVCEPPATELAETFTDYLHHSKLVIFQEIMNFEGLNLENKLKVMLAAPPDMLRVRLFGRGFYETPNIVQAIFMSNYRDALHISEGDGRYFAIWSDVKPCSQEYYQRLCKWLESSGNGLVVRWLLNRDLSSFNPKQPAPMTQFKSELVKTSHSPLKYLLLDMIEAFDYPFNVDCVRSLDIAKVVKDKYSAKAIGSVLSEIGCINRECKRSTGKRGKASLFIVRNMNEWSGKTSSYWLDEYDARRDRNGLKDTGT